MENEQVVQWLDAPGTDKPLGVRSSLLDFQYPTSRAAWGQERSFLLKGSNFGSIDSLRDEWDLDNNVHFGGGNNLIGNHNYEGGAKHTNGQQIWYDSTEDCNYHAGLLADTIATGHFKGGGMTEWGVGSWQSMSFCARMHGKLHTAM